MALDVLEPRNFLGLWMAGVVLIRPRLGWPTKREFFDRRRNELFFRLNGIPSLSLGTVLCVDFFLACKRGVFSEKEFLKETSFSLCLFCCSFCWQCFLISFFSFFSFFWEEERRALCRRTIQGICEGKWDKIALANSSTWLVSGAAV